MGEVQPRQSLGITGKKTETKAIVLFSVLASKVLPAEADVTMEKRKVSTPVCVCVCVCVCVEGASGPTKSKDLSACFQFSWWGYLSFFL